MKLITKLLKSMLTDDCYTLDYLPPALYTDATAGLSPLTRGLFYTDLRDLAEFDVRLCNALQQTGVTKVHELAGLSARDLLKTRGIGKKARTVINDFLAAHRLGGNQP